MFDNHNSEKFIIFSKFHTTKYVEKDLKETRYIINQKKATVKEIPSREDSLDRLMEIGKDFADCASDFQDSTILKIMLDEALAKLSDEERYEERHGGTLLSLSPCQAARGKVSEILLFNYSHNSS